MKAITFLAALAAAFQLCTSSTLASGDWTWPVHGTVITPYRNGSDPYAAGQHRGIDIAAPVGDPVVAATAGRVTFAGVAGSSGLTVSIRTSGGGFDTSYLHLSSAAVRAGQTVAAGDRVGAVGTSGRRSADQPHLHFGVREAGKRQVYRDPLDFLAPAPSAPPEPSAPRTAPAPVGDRAPIPPPAPLAVPAPWRGAVPSPGTPALRTHLPALHLPLPHRAAPPGSRHADGSAQSASAPAGRVGVVPRRVAQHVLSAHADGRHAAGAAAPAELGPASGGDGAARAVRAARPPRVTAAPAHHSGFDAGWMAACLGLVAAACALGRPAGARAALLMGRGAFAALLRPLGGRG